MTTIASPGRQREFVSQFAGPLRAYLRTETGGAALLLLFTVAAMAWANSPWSETYHTFWATEVAFEVASFEIREDLRHWVNDALMVLFFFVVGLELRRQLSMGELTDPRRVAVPVVAAVAGLAVPAVVYLGFNPSDEAARGWGVAMATDTAFALGVLALVGRALPTRLRVFMLSVAVVDDIGALTAIAVFYSDDISLAALAASAVCLVLIFALGRFHVWRGPAYLVVGVALWVAMVESGVHPTLGGVIVGLLISAYPPRPEEVARAGALTRAFGQSPLPELARSAKLSVERAVSPNERLQELLHPWTSFVVVPIFALANAGVTVDRELLARAVDSPVTHGVVAGLVVGKLLGVGLGTALAVRLGLGSLPPGMRKVEIWGCATVAGIGFTIALFVVDLAFESPALQDEARLGVLAASVLAAAAGFAVFRIDRALRRGASIAPPTRLARPVDSRRDHVLGPSGAVLELVEYGDFQCPFCGRATGAVEAVRARFGDDLRYVFRHLPLAEVHPDAVLAAEAAEAAGAQGAYWEMHDRLFAHQDRLGPEDLVAHAEALGLDVERFARELGAGVHAQRVREDVASAEDGGAIGTPTFFVNGTRHVGRYDDEALSRALAAHLPDRPPVWSPEEARGAVTQLPLIGRLREAVPDAAPSSVDESEGVVSRDDGFPRLSPAQIARLDRYGRRYRVAIGKPLFGAGEPRPDFVVVVSGAVAMVDGYGRDNLVRNVHGPGRFIGELGILQGRATLLTAVAQQDCEVLVVPAERLAPALDSDPELREVVYRTFLLRRSQLVGLASREPNEEDT